MNSFRRHTLIPLALLLAVVAVDSLAWSSPDSSTMTSIDPALVSDVVRALGRVKAVGAPQGFSCPVFDSLPTFEGSGDTATRVARAAMELVGYEDRSKRAPDGLKCAVQTSNVLKRAGVPVEGSASVVSLVAQLKKAGWCESPRPIAGAIAYANDEFGNGPRSHIGVVSYPAPQIRQKVEEGMSPALQQRFSVEDPYSRAMRPLTIYHNSTRFLIGWPRGKIDQVWYSKVLFVVPPEQCRREI